MRFTTVYFVVHCGNPPLIDNGFILNEKSFYEIGSVVIYQCHEQLVIIGSSQNTCLQSEKWRLTFELGNLPVCCKVSLIEEFFSFFIDSSLEEVSVFNRAWYGMEDHFSIFHIDVARIFDWGGTST